jgi:hypothetical protein
MGGKQVTTTTYAYDEHGRLRQTVVVVEQVGTGLIHPPQPLKYPTLPPLGQAVGQSRAEPDPSGTVVSMSQHRKGGQ